jgi:hypothetical protein
MRDLVRLIVCAVVDLFRSRAAIGAEILALRQQIIVLRRTAPKKQTFGAIVGAIAFRLNGHYAKPEANKAKKELCDYILKRAKITNPAATTPLHLKRITILHRDGTLRPQRK